MYDPEQPNNDDGGIVGARGFDHLESGDYVPPEFEVAPEKKASSSFKIIFLFAVVPLLAVVGLIGMYVYSNVADTSNATALATQVIDDLFDDIAAGTASEGMSNMCPPDPDWAWATYELASKAGVKDGAELFTLSDSVVVQTQEPLKSSYNSTSDGTEFDAIMPPAYDKWVVLYGTEEYTQAGPIPVSIHVALGPSGNCVVAMREQVNDVESMRTSGSARQFLKDNAPEDTTSTQ